MRTQVQEEGRLSVRLAARLLAALALAPAVAQASIFKGEALDAAADYLAWFVLIVIPFVAIGAFLYVHVLPEVIAEKRHHPHKDSIKVLCILSLFFGGMLWPFAWLWAYTKPVGYRAIYGTEKHEDYYLEVGEKARLGALTAEEFAQLRAELAAMAAKGTLSAGLRKLAADLDALAAAPPMLEQPAPAAGGGR